MDTRGLRREAVAPPHSVTPNSRNGQMERSEEEEEEDPRMKCKLSNPLLLLS
jgi:hypothetical protein